MHKKWMHKIIIQEIIPNVMVKSLLDQGHQNLALRRESSEKSLREKRRK
jgi:hypothetical protein